MRPFAAPLHRLRDAAHALAPWAAVAVGWSAVVVGAVVGVYAGALLAQGATLWIELLVSAVLLLAAIVGLPDAARPEPAAPRNARLLHGVRRMGRRCAILAAATWCGLAAVTWCLSAWSGWPSAWWPIVAGTALALTILLLAGSDRKR